MLDSAAFDVVEIMQGKHHRIYDRAFGKDRTFWTEASPYHRLTTAPAPILVVCSTRRDEACPQAQPFASKSTKLGGRVVVLPVDMKHGEINKELGLPSDYTTTVERSCARWDCPENGPDRHGVRNIKPIFGVGTRDRI